MNVKIIKNYLNTKVGSNIIVMYYGSRNKKNSEHIATCTDGTIFKFDFTSNKFEGHAFAITNITNDTITFVNPWNSSKSYTMTWNEFAKLGIGMINIADSNDFEFVKNDNETETPETEIPDEDHNPTDEDPNENGWGWDWGDDGNTREGDDATIPIMATMATSTVTTETATIQVITATT